MNVVHVFKADPIRPTDPVPSTTIIMDTAPPDTDAMEYPELEALWEAQARLIADALYASLPGGTHTALTGLLLQQSAARHLRVRL